MSPPSNRRGVNSPTEHFYAYVAVDVRVKPHKPVFIELTRQEAQKKRQWHADADYLRVKRTYCRPYDK
jgi:hypothetical protein